MIYLPTFDCEWALSRWSGRPQGLAIDPLGVECGVTAPIPKRRLFQRRAAEPAASVYLHVLVHTDLSSDRIRSWARGQVAQLGVLETYPDARGDDLNRLTESELAALEGLEWTLASVTVDGVARQGSALVVRPDRWAAFIDLGADRVVLVGSHLALDDVALRAATSDEARQVRTAALRV